MPDGKSRLKYAKDQRTVREWLQAQQNQLRQGLLPKDDSVTVAQFLANYMETVGKHTLRPKTIEAYSYLIRTHIIPTLGKIRLSQLRPDHIQSLYAQTLEKGLSRRTVQFIHSIIHKSLEQAMRWGLAVRNVSDLVDPPSPESAIPQSTPPNKSTPSLRPSKMTGFMYFMFWQSTAGSGRGSF